MSSYEILSPLKPVNLSAWEIDTINNPELAARAHSIARWFHKAEHFSVISAVEVVEEEPGAPARPEYHISISQVRRRGRALEIARVDSATALDVLRMFGAEGFLEDNHVQHGKVRNFWRPVAGDYVGQVCRCQDAEPAIREDKGDYVWRGT